MTDMVYLTEQPISTAELLELVADRRSGAVVLFMGTTREFTDGRQTASLEYDCHVAMARHKMQQLRDEACQRWPLVQCALVHRIGHVGLGEASVGIAVSAAHRREAFEAGQWLIDSLKETVPIWKKEHWADGRSEWVHPASSPPQAPPDTYNM